jgi:hypothetical protein
MESHPVAYGVRDKFGYHDGEDAQGFNAAERALWRDARTPEDREVIMQLRDERRLREHQGRGISPLWPSWLIGFDRCPEQPQNITT